MIFGARMTTQLIKKELRNNPQLFRNNSFLLFHNPVQRNVIAARHGDLQHVNSLCE